MTHVRIATVLLLLLGGRALWLEGRYGETPPFPSDRPQYEVVKVGDVVDETVELRGERAK